MSEYEFISNSLKRRDALNFCSGYMCALNDLLNKKDVAIGLGLKGNDVINFINVECKAMISAAEERFDKLEKLYHSKESE